MELDARRHEYDLVGAGAVVDELFLLLGTEDIAATIEGAVRDGTLPLEKGIATLEIAVWSGTENGASLHRSTERWLTEADEPLRVALALGLGRQVYPFANPGDMMRALRRVASLFPELGEACRALMEGRARLRE